MNRAWDLCSMMIKVGAWERSTFDLTVVSWAKGGDLICTVEVV